MAVRKITCGVRLGDPTEQLAHARQRATGGDESWARWVEEYEAGDALILTLDVAVILDGISPSPARVTNRGVWIEKNVHAPLVAGQVQQAVTKDFNLLAARLSEVGVTDLTANDLAMMYVDVELGEDVLEELRRAKTSSRLQPQHAGDFDGEF